MNDELYTILDRIWLEGQFNGGQMSFHDWLHEEGCEDREDYLLGQIKEALVEIKEERKIADDLHKKLKEAATEYQKDWNGVSTKVAFIDGAGWVLTQVKEHLEKKLTAKLQACESFEKGSDVWWDYTTSATAIEEIINELFKKN